MCVRVRACVRVCVNAMHDLVGLSVHECECVCSVCVCECVCVVRIYIINTNIIINIVKLMTIIIITTA